jgi:hypothetical protein
MNPGNNPPSHDSATAPGSVPQSVPKTTATPPITQIAKAHGAWNPRAPHTEGRHLESRLGFPKDSLSRYNIRLW